MKLILSGRACSHKEKQLTARDSESPAHDGGVLMVFVTITISRMCLGGFVTKVFLMCLSWSCTCSGGFVEIHERFIS